MIAVLQVIVAGQRLIRATDQLLLVNVVHDLAIGCCDSQTPTARLFHVADVDKVIISLKRVGDERVAQHDANQPVGRRMTQPSLQRLNNGALFAQGCLVEVHAPCIGALQESLKAVILLAQYHSGLGDTLSQQVIQDPADHGLAVHWYHGV